MAVVSLSDLTTPALLLERGRMERNASAMLEKSRRSGVLFRPHVKTHKTIEGALLQHGGERGPITVSTMAEAEFFADHGFRDITYAFPIAPAKFDRAVALAERIERLNLLLDNRQTFAEVAAYAEAQGVTFDFFLKVDCGYGRAGVDLSEESLRFAAELSASPYVRLRGLLTHAGHSYHAADGSEIRAIAEQENGAVTKFAAKMRERGVEAGIRSVGSTPTASIVDAFTDCEEVRPGNYLFFDAYQAALGSCSLEDCALSVLSTIVGVYPAQNKVIVDAGSLALSREEAYGEEGSYGVVCDERLRSLPLSITSLSQEHGQIFANENFDVRSLTIGTRLRIIANHSCITAALFDRYYVVEGTEVVEEWKPVRGW